PGRVESLERAQRAAGTVVRQLPDLEVRVRGVHLLEREDLPGNVEVVSELVLHLVEPELCRPRERAGVIEIDVNLERRGRIGVGRALFRCNRQVVTAFRVPQTSHPDIRRSISRQPASTCAMVSSSVPLLSMTRSARASFGAIGGCASMRRRASSAGSLLRSIKRVICTSVSMVTTQTWSQWSACPLSISLTASMTTTPDVI